MTERRFRLPRSSRLLRRADFQRVYAEGSRARGALMTVVVAEGRTPETRMGLSIGKAVWKSAVRRNRVRRVFREAFRLVRAELPRGIDLVLVGSRAGIRPRLEETRHELLELVPKAHARYLEKRAGARPAEPGPEPADGARSPEPIPEERPADGERGRP